MLLDDDDDELDDVLDDEDLDERQRSKILNK